MVRAIQNLRRKKGEKGDASKDEGLKFQNKQTPKQTTQTVR